MESILDKELRKLAQFEALLLKELEQSASKQIFGICELTKMLALEIKGKCQEQRLQIQRLKEKNGLKMETHELQILRYQIEDIDLTAQIRKTVSYDVSLHLPSPTNGLSGSHSQSLIPRNANLYCFSPDSNQVFTYHVGNKTHTHIDSTFRLKQDAVWVQLSPSQILYTGGVIGHDTTSDCAVFLSLESRWEARESMRIGRGQHGAVVFDGSVYVFGGYHSHTVLRDNEKYGSGGQWVSIAQLLTPLCYVSVTELKGSIYIAGRWSSKIQIYAVKQDSMSEADVQLSDHSGAPMISYDDRILLLNNDHIYVFLPSHSSLKPDVRKVNSGGLFWSPMQWVVFGKAAFGLEYGVMNVWKYDFNSGELGLETALEGEQ